MPAQRRPRPEYRTEFLSPRNANEWADAINAVAAEGWELFALVPSTTNVVAVFSRITT